MPASTFAKMLDLLEIPVSFLIDERIRLNVPALKEALRDVFSGKLPVVDEGMSILPVSIPDNRSEKEYEQDLKMLAYILRDRYENRIYLELELPVESR